MHNQVIFRKKPEGAVRLRPHKTKTLRNYPWPYCQYCGLVYLKNRITRIAIRRGCWLYEDE